MNRDSYEKLDFATAKTIAETWGYGNLISFLRSEWAIMLCKKHKISAEAALRSTAVGPSVEHIENQLD